jgi:putative selenium metabolism hydrolase
MSQSESLRDLSARIKELASQHQEYTCDLLQRLIRIPSPSCGEEEAIKAVRLEMGRCRPDEVFIDSMGSAVARFGSGKHVILYDSHLDTVGVGDPASWSVDPFGGRRRHGVIYGRGASDNKAGIACMVTGLKVLTQLGQAGDFTLYVVGIVQEEDCEGLALSLLLDERQIRPDCVVLGECTDLGISRGHRGRAEMEVVTKGISCHASAPDRGENAIYKMTPLIESIRWMSRRLGSDPFLGKASLAVTSIECQTPSRNAIPDLCRIYLDRRTIPSDTPESITREIDEIARFSQAAVRITAYAGKSYRGLFQERQRFFPAWTVPEDSPVVSKACQAYQLLFEKQPKVGKWDFSTDGNYSMGAKAIPTIGFGPGEERYVHTVEDQVRVEDLWKAVALYALFPFVYST